MSNYAFSRTNYVLLAIGFAVVIAGFALMSGPGTTTEAFDPDIFSARRIVAAPMVCLAGFLMVVAAILWKSKTFRREARAWRADAPKAAADSATAAASSPSAAQAAGTKRGAL